MSTKVIFQSWMSLASRSILRPPSLMHEIVGDRLVVVEEVLLDAVRPVAQAQDEVLVPEVRVVAHDVPEDRPVADAAPWAWGSTPSSRGAACPGRRRTGRPSWLRPPLPARDAERVRRSPRAIPVHRPPQAISQWRAGPASPASAAVESTSATRTCSSGRSGTAPKRGAPSPGRSAGTMLLHHVAHGDELSASRRRASAPVDALAPPPRPAARPRRRRCRSSRPGRAPLDRAGASPRRSEQRDVGDQLADVRLRRAVHHEETQPDRRRAVERVTHARVGRRRRAWRPRRASEGTGQAPSGGGSSSDPADHQARHRPLGGRHQEVHGGEEVHVQDRERPRRGRARAEAMPARWKTISGCTAARTRRTSAMSATSDLPPARRRRPSAGGACRDTPWTPAPASRQPARRRRRR